MLQKKLPIILIAAFILLAALLFYVGKVSRYGEVLLRELGGFGAQGQWTEPELRKTALPFYFRNMKGEKISFEAFRGDNPLLLVFWKTDCPACVSELPKLRTLEAQWSVRGVKFLALNEDASWKTVKRYADTQKPPYMIGWDEDGSAAFRYQVRGVPFAVALDRNGKIAYEGFEIPGSLENLFEGPSGS